MQAAEKSFTTMYAFCGLIVYTKTASSIKWL